MKCIVCDTNNTLRDRVKNNGICQQCQHPFAFEPATMQGVKITDRFFADAIEDISAHQTLFFTFRQLLYTLDRRVKKVRISDLEYNNLTVPAIITGIAFSITWGWGFLVEIDYPFLAAAIVGMVSYGISTMFSQLVHFGGGGTVTTEQLQEWIDAWERINSPIEKLLPKLPAENNSIAIDPEISAYSFDRVVICEKDAIAQLLIANNFHFENNCAILSANGYPQSIFNTILTMLRRNAELKVYIFHDASASGISLVRTIRTSSDWFGNQNVLVCDIGLLPRQFFSRFRVDVRVSPAYAAAAKQLPPIITQTLTDRELRWLQAGKFVELDSFSPAKIIELLHKGIAIGRTAASSDQLLVNEVSMEYVYSVDNFG